jgi:CheY-like chemotaxis protein
VADIGSPDPRPTGSQGVRFSFEATSLRQAVEAAGMLRRVFPYGVRVRPAQLSRLGAYEWAIVVTTGPLAAGRTAALEEEMRWVARRAVGVKFTGWLSLSGPLRVLIVDSSARFRAAAREWLELGGCSVVGEADSAATGLVAFDRLKPDAVVLDVKLPDGSGFDVCELLAQEPDAPAVLLVTSAGATDAAAGKARGAEAFLPKEDLVRVDLRAICAKRAS